jgi:CheY-like chemotaxis protein
MMLKDMQVLVIDNDRDSLTLYSTLLESYGAHAVTAESIKKALDIFDLFIPDLVICETRFRSESINTLTTRLGEMERGSKIHIPAIAITTWLTDSLAHVLEIGFEGYLLKPINLDALVSMVENLNLSNQLTFSGIAQS